MKNLDDKIKKAFEQKESQLEKLELWQAIEKELPEEKKDRKFFIWFLFGGLIIIAGLLVHHYLGSIDQSDNHKTSTEKQAKVYEDSNTKSISAPSIDLNSNIKIDSTIISNNNASPIKIPSNSKNSEYNKSTINLTAKKQAQAFNPSSEQSRKTGTPIKGQIFGMPKDLIKNPISNKEVAKTVPMRSNALPFIKILLPELVTTERIDTTIIRTKISLLSTPPISKWSAKIYTNYLNLDRSFSGGNQDFINQKSSSEKIRYAYNAGALIDFDLTSKLTIGMGIDYTVHEEVINWTGVVGTTTTPFQSDSAFFFNYFQKTFYIPGTRNFIETSTRSLRKYNRIEQWSIPIELNYTAIQNKRLKFYLTGGAKFNLSNKLAGKFLGLYNEILEERIYSIYKKSNVHTWYGGLGIEFNLTPKLSLTSDFRYQSSFNMLIKDELDTAIRYRGYSIGLGLKRRF